MQQKDRIADYVFREYCRGKSTGQIIDELKKGGWWDQLTTFSYKYEANYGLKHGFEKFKKAYPERAAKVEAAENAKKLSTGLTILLAALILLYLLDAGGWQVVVRAIQGLLEANGIR